jgi:hypothetical protein
VAPLTKKNRNFFGNPGFLFGFPGFFLVFQFDFVFACRRVIYFVSKKLHQVIEKNFGNGHSNLNFSISGHSMGGHGALISFLKNPAKYKSVSAFAPICHPTNCDWGKFAFTGYLGEIQESWKV